MSGHPDRLAGLVVLSAVTTGIPTVLVRGVSRAGLARAVGSDVELADAPVPGGGAVVAAADAADATAHLDELQRSAPGERPGLVWLLWGGTGSDRAGGSGRAGVRRGGAAVQRRAARAGLEVVASYGFVGGSASPTHLVREGEGHALRWFASCVRPRWGPRSRLARLGNYLPRVGHRFLDGQAVLLRAVDGGAVAWPGADVAGPDSGRGDGHGDGHGDGAATAAPQGPAVIHCGGGATAGRLVLTWADGSGAPTRHTKLAPQHLAGDVVAEANALTALAGLPVVAGSVPTLLGLRRGPTSAALTASHLPGRPPRATRVTRVLGRATHRLPALGGLAALPGVAAWPIDVDASVTAWLAALARASHGRTAPVVRAAAGAERLALAVASIDDPALQSVVRRGLTLGSGSHGLLHGDFWPGNVHRVGGVGGAARLAVLDWESALVGHPLVDLLTWLVGNAGGEQVRDRALTALRGEASAQRRGTAAHHVCTLLATLGQRLEPREIEALVLSQLLVVAVEGGPARGDGAHERAWLEAVGDVWASWQWTGRSPWSAPCEVSR